MSTELQKPQFNPFQRNQLPEHTNIGSVAVEQERAIAEAQGKLIIAKRFPRDEARAFQMAMDACSRPSLAAVATYKYPRGGQRLSGPSIRLAEELARCWGNIDYGIRELSRKEGVSEMQAFAWDLQTNTMSSQNFTVRHLRDKSEGPVNLESERDIYEVTANMGARRLRARLLAILPPDLVEAAEAQCRAALAGNTQLPIADRVRDLLGMFVNYGVKEAQLSQYLNKSLDQVLEEDLVNLHEIYNSINQGISKASDWFGRQPAVEPQQASDLGSILAQQAAKAALGNGQQHKQQHPDVTPVDENKDPTNACDNWLKTMEAAPDTQALEKHHTDAYNRMNELGRYWVEQGDREKAELCSNFKSTIQVRYHELKTELMQGAGA